MFLNGYPYTDFHEMNADFLLQSMNALKKAFSEFTASNSIILAEPLLHSISSSYAKNTIVLDPDGNAYISLQNVPAGIQLSNADYWMMVFNFEEYTEKANKNFTDNYFRDTDRAPYALSIGDWVVLNDVLYKVAVDIAQDEAFEIGVNLIHFTVEQFLKDFTTSIVQTVNQYKNDIDASELAYHLAMQAEVDRILAGATVDSEVIDARLGANGVNYTTLGNAIRGQMGLTYFNRFTLPDNSDLDAITTNSVYQISSGAEHIPDHYPTELGTGASVVITNQFVQNDTNYMTQLVIGYSHGVMYYRRKSTTWGNWERLAISVSEIVNYYKNNYVLADNSDLDTITDNCVYQIASGAQHIPDHYPSALGTEGGVLITNKFLSNGGTLTQFLVSYTNGYLYNRYYTSGSWSAWNKCSATPSELSSAISTLSGISYINNYTLPDNSDLDAITTNSVYQISSGAEHIPDHYPTELGTGASVVITNQFVQNDTNYMTQLVIGYSHGVMYYRRKSTTWSNWEKISFSTSDLVDYNKNNHVLADNSDLDNITDNSTWFVASGAQHTPTHYPDKMGTSAGVVITLKMLSNSNNNLSQFCFNNTWGTTFYRRKAGTWGNWIQLTTPFNPNKKIYAYGDSVTYGYSSNMGNIQSPYNFPQLVADALHMDLSMKAEPGQGLITDWSDIITAITADTYSDVGLFIVNWAYNDAAQFPSMNFGAYNDPIEANPTTFLGHYARILELLQKKNKLAKVILVTGYGSPPNGTYPWTTQFTYTYHFADGDKTVKEMYDELEKTANYNGFDCINQSKGCGINPTNADAVIGDNIHPTYEGYRTYSNTVAAKVISLFRNL